MTYKFECLTTEVKCDENLHQPINYQLKVDHVESICVLSMANNGSRTKLEKYQNKSEKKDKNR